MANIAIPVPGYGVGGVRRAVVRVRRYPVLPLAVLIFLLVIPAIFATQITDTWLHNPLEGKLSERLTPPFWQEGGVLGPSPGHR
jgi:hypothetical protein